MMNEEETEIWRDVVGYEGLYKVSNLGNVKSLRHKKTFLMKTGQHSNGYLFVRLSNHNKLIKSFLVHRLVSKAFLPNPNNLPQVNHKDEDKTNNRVDNLEWCDAKYNLNFGTVQERKSKKLSKILKNRKDQSKPVLQYDKNDIFINEYPSIKDAQRKTGVHQGAICRVCRGKLKSTGGFLWKYADN